MIGPSMPGYGIGTRCPVCHCSDCPGCEPEADEDDCCSHGVGFDLDCEDCDDDQEENPCEN
jgi:hypothetical protein